MKRIWFGLASSCRITFIDLRVETQSDKDRGTAGQKLMHGTTPMGYCIKIWSEKDHEDLIQKRSQELDPKNIMKIWSEKNHENLIRIKIVTWSWLV